ncbi:MAG TPA: PLDc N-terminal domain-containing protein [Pseudolabrys sp.]|nr:PLDc N-terminal domain-containing protein [Pseudolabrys sp.]
MLFDYNGIIGLIILVLDIWAIVQIVQGGGPTDKKVLWVLIILLLPVIGLILWLMIARRARL